MFGTLVENLHLKQKLKRRFSKINLFYEIYWNDIIDEFNNHEKTIDLSSIKIKFQKD
jgi:hypothetical protein